MTDDNQKLVIELNELMNRPGGKQAARFILNALGGAIPFAGGFISGAVSIWGEKEQQVFNEKITAWASNTNENLAQIWSHLASQLREPTKAHMTLLLGEVIRIELPDKPPESGEWKISLILHGQTVEELKMFESKGWIRLQSNGNMTNMGAGNKIGNSIEDQKRPWGMGNGFVLIISNEFYE
ncbi:MAG TPA: hypothetical protein VIM59_04585 [Cellvibrio sp.]